MNFTTPRRVLALVFEDNHVTAVTLDGGESTVCAPFAVDPLADDPPLVAQELRERLQTRGRLPNRVVVGLPLNRIMVSTVTVPQMPEEDVVGFLRIQAEREFLLPPGEMALGISQIVCPDGRRNAVLAALPLRQYVNLQRALRLVGARRMSVHPATTALVGGHRFEARLVVGARACDLILARDGCLMLLRRVAGPAADATQTCGLDLGALPGELRVSLRQFPADALGADDPALEVFGRHEHIEALVGELRGDGLPKPWRLVPTPQQKHIAVIACERAAAKALGNRAIEATLLPVPALRDAHRLPFRQRRHLLAAIGMVAFLVLTLAGLAVRQRHRLATVRHEWESMAPRVEALTELMAHAKARGPWRNDHPECLDMWRALTLAFPERGSVWATRVELRARRQVNVSGQATSREALLAMLEALGRTPGIHDLRVAQMRDAADGRSPMTYALGFTWQRPRAAPATPEALP